MFRFVARWVLATYLIGTSVTAATTTSPVKSSPSADDFVARYADRVDFQHAERLDAAMKQAGAVSLLVPVENAGHAIPRTPKIQQRTRDFCDRYLRGIEKPALTETIIAPNGEPTS